jgi:hypothetical protein
MADSGVRSSCDRVARNSSFIWLVRSASSARQPFVLEQHLALLGGALGRFVQARVVDRHRGLGRDAAHDALGAFGEHPVPGWPKNMVPSTSPECATTGTAR